MPREAHEELTGLQNALLNTDNVEQFLHELAVLSTRIVPGGLSCGMTLRLRGRAPVTAACSDPLASQADDVQYQAGDGPCLRAARTGEEIRIDDMSAESRWPEFAARAVSLGILSSLSLPLFADSRPIGALNWYTRRPGAFGPEEAARARSFAGNASGALTLALRMASCNDLTDQLRESMVSRAVIDQALGVIMATERCPHDRAFALLRSVSQNTNTKLRDLAANIVTSVSGEPPRAGTPFEEDA
ncbi:MAG: GAF and ANTAR domain-containing protein [Trebonia sp.]